MSNDVSLAIKIGFDGSAVQKGMSRLSEQYRASLQEMQATSGKLDAFGPMKRQTDEARKAWQAAQADVARLAREISDADAPSKGLTTQFAAAKKEAQGSKQAFKEQQLALEVLRRELQTAGVAAGNASAGQAKLRTSISATNQVLSRLKTADSAREILGIRGNDEINAEINQAKAAYNALKETGLASTSELARAGLALTQQVGELKGELSGMPTVLDQIKEGAAGLIAAAAGIGLTIHQAILFESAMSDVKKVVDFDSPKGFIQLSRELKDLSREMPITAEGLARIAEAGGQMGTASEDIKGFVTVTAKMASAFKMLPEEAGKAVGELMNQFALSIPQVVKLGDTLNQLGNKTNATEKDIIAVLTRTGGMARQFGLTAEQVAALATTMLSLGKTPEIAATGINALLLKLQTGKTQSKEFQDALANIGLSSRQLATDIAANPQVALQKFLATIALLDKQTAAETLAQLFGAEYSDDLATLVGGLELYQKALTISEDKTASAGSMNREFAERIKTTEAQLQLAKNAITEAAIALGTVFLPAVVLAAKSVASMVQSIATLIENYPLLSAAAAVALSVLAGYAALRAIYAGVVIAITSMSASLATLGGASTAAGTGMATFAASMAAVAPQVIALTALFAASYWAGGKIAEMIVKESAALRDERAEIAQSLQIYKEFNTLKTKLADASAPAGAVDQVQQAKQAALADRDSYQQNLAAAQEYVNGAIALIQKLANERQRLSQLLKNLDQAVAAEEKKLAEETLRSQISAMEQVAQQRKTRLDAALNEERQYIERVKELHSKLADAKSANEDRLREIKRRGMSEEQQQSDILAQAKDKQNKAADLNARAQTAANQGRNKEAEQLAQLAQKEAEGAASLGERLKDNKQAYELVAKSGELIEQGIKAEIAANNVAAQIARYKAANEYAAYQRVLGLINDLTTQLTALTAEDKHIAIKAEIDDAMKAIAQLQAEINGLKDKTVTVTLAQRNTHQASSPTGLQGGGALAGYGGGDRIPALLEAGEFVLRKEAVRKYGSGLIWRLNQMNFDSGKLPRFALGGLVGGGLTPALASAPASANDSITVNLNLGGKTFVMQSERQQARQLVETLRFMDRGRVA
ncbi:phage tail tape measure protein [Iodobacter sp.]|uniref:phage tail tape measure protein n=1 Tax=Iodobacter sp. TaxID=1915058 RepID=UPI0025DE822B|nr:phage tail tape measure protein [Iodobacter sp.]